MRLLALILLIALILGLSQAIPLQGGSDAVKCTLFGLIKTPVSQDMNYTQADLQLDIGLLGSQNATYELVDSKDNIYKPIAYKSLQPGRTLLIFEVPETALFKLLKVTPKEGKPFNINWWKTPKGTKGDIIIRYYGVVDLVTQADQQAIAYEIKMANNGTAPLAVSPDNFTLLDQWGWPYYTTSGFTATEIPSKKAIDVNLVFGGISPFSRPSVLAYDYGTDNQIIIDLDKDMVQLTDSQIYGTASSQTSQTQNAQAPQTAQASQVAQPPQVAKVPEVNPVPQFNKISQPTGATLKPASFMPPAPKTQGPTVSGTQTSGSTAGGKSVQDAKNQTAKSVMSLKDEINASRQRLSGLKSGITGGKSTVGQKISASIEETKKRLEAMKKGLQNSTKNQTQNNTTASNIATS